MVIIKKSPEEIEKMAAAGLIQAAALDLVAGKIRPGVSTEELDGAVERFIRSQGAIPTFKGYRGFPGSICASPNRWSCTASRGDIDLSAATSSRWTSV